MREKGERNEIERGEKMTFRYVDDQYTFLT